METKNKTNKKLLLQILNKSITVRMTTLKILADQVYYFTKKYCLLYYVDEECPPDMNSFKAELEIINGGAFNNENIVADSTLDRIRGYLNILIPQLLARLQNDQMQESLNRIDSLQWRELFGIGVVVTSEENRGSPSPTDSISR